MTLAVKHQFIFQNEIAAFESIDEQCKKCIYWIHAYTCMYWCY